jgi:hypothetical protein
MGTSPSSMSALIGLRQGREGHDEREMRLQPIDEPLVSSKELASLALG